MKSKVFKYEVQLTDEQTINVPRGAELLTIGPQHGKLMLWARVDPDAPVEPRKLYIHGTGHDVNEHAEDYVTTLFLQNGSLVFHVFW